MPRIVFLINCEGGWVHREPVASRHQILDRNRRAMKVPAEGDFAASFSGERKTKESMSADGIGGLEKMLLALKPKQGSESLVLQ